MCADNSVGTHLPINVNSTIRKSRPILFALRHGWCPMRRVNLIHQHDDSPNRHLWDRDGYFDTAARSLHQVNRASGTRGPKVAFTVPSEEAQTAETRTTSVQKAARTSRDLYADNSSLFRGALLVGTCLEVRYIQSVDSVASQVIGAAIVFESFAVKSIEFSSATRTMNDSHLSVPVSSHYELLF